MYVWLDDMIWTVIFYPKTYRNPMTIMYIYISYLYLIVYISIYFQTVNFVLTMAEEEGRKFGWWWSPFRGAQVVSDIFIFI